MTPSGFNPLGVKPAPRDDSKIRGSLLEVGDIVVSRSNTRERVGLAGIYEGVPENCAYPDLLMRVRPDLASLDVEYLAHQLLSAESRKYLQSCARGTSESMVKINRAALENLPLLLPPLPEQRKIAAILSSVDEVIEKTEAVIEQLQVVKKAMTQDLLTRGLPGRHTRFVKTEIGEIPEEWEVASLGEIASFVNGRGFKSSEWGKAGTPIIRIQNLNGSPEFNIFDGEVAEQHRVAPGDLLFAWSGSRGTSFGPHVWRGPHGLLNQHIFNVRPVDRTTKPFLHHALRKLTRYIEERAHGTGGLVHITKRELESMAIGLPPRAEQQQIALCLSSADECIETERTVLSRLVGTKTALMRTLLTGQLRVTPDEEAA